MGTIPFSRVAILLRTKDRPIFLERALQSVLAQTESDWRIIILNDGGERGTVENLRQKYEKQLAGRAELLHFSRSEGRGTGKLLNAGLEASDSEFVAIHDDDDTWHPHFLARTLAHIQENAAVVAHSLLVKECAEGEGFREISREPYEPWQKHGISLFRLAESLTFPPIALLFRRRVLREIGAFSPELGPLEDWEFVLRLFAHAHVPLVEEPLAFYHQRVDGQVGEESANSRVRNEEIYGRLDTEIRNRLLRQDLAAGKVGLGFLVNIAQMQGRLFREMKDRV